MVYKEIQSVMYEKDVIQHTGIIKDIMMMHTDQPTTFIYLFIIVTNLN